jgi:DNA-binding IclR family transcriptional regulator
LIPPGLAAAGDQQTTHRLDVLQHPHSSDRRPARATNLNNVVTVGASDGNDVVCIAGASVVPIERALMDGTHILGHTSALGELLIAQLPWAKVQDRIERHGLHAVTSTRPSTARSCVN